MQLIQEDCLLRRPGKSRCARLRSASTTSTPITAPAFTRCRYPTARAGSRREVVAVGDGVTTQPGDRIAYGAGPIGAYASLRNLPAHRVCKLPDSISDETAAAMMLKGMTVRYLLRQTYAVQAGDTVLYHAAAGGVGLIFCQWARALGATVIGTVGSAEKAQIAREHGCHHTINYREEDVAARVRN
ncbi:MAG: zinc-binding dehydrogenase [Thiolinea sp.]